jgi:SET domain-containing protein
MGIFAKRDILKGEELTFNYNVDRYGSAYYFLFSFSTRAFSYRCRTVMTRKRATAERMAV